MIAFNERISHDVSVLKRWATLGSPWEFNLRDLFRWCDLMLAHAPHSHPKDFVHLIFAARFRTHDDRRRVYECFQEVFSDENNNNHNESKPYWQESTSSLLRFAKTHVQIGQSFLAYSTSSTTHRTQRALQLKPNKFFVTNTNVKYLELIAKCMEMNWMCVLVGRSCTGKTSLVRMLASLVDVNLVEFSVNNATDTSDLLGGFEKVKHNKSLIIGLYDLFKSVYLSSLVVKNTSSNQPTTTSLARAYFSYLFDSHRLFNAAANDDLDENRDVAVQALDLFKKNLQALNSFKIITGNYTILLNSHFIRINFYID